MSKRVEEIRRTFNFDPWALGVGDTRVLLEHIESLTAALAQAEREREIAMGRAQSERIMRDAAKAEVERLRAQHRKEISEIVSQAQDVTEAAEARTRALVEALIPFASGGHWGVTKAWIVEGAPTRERGIDIAKHITGCQVIADAALTEPTPPQGDECHCGHCRYVRASEPTEGPAPGGGS